MTLFSKSDTTTRAWFPIRGSMFKNSNYLQIWNQLTAYYDKVSLDEYWRGRIYPHLCIYQENILVLDGDKFIEDPVQVLQSVERFLHIPPFFTDQHFTHNGYSTH